MQPCPVANWQGSNCNKVGAGADLSSLGLVAGARVQPLEMAIFGPQKPIQRL